MIPNLHGPPQCVTVTGLVVYSMARSRVSGHKSTSLLRGGGDQQGGGDMSAIRTRGAKMINVVKGSGTVEAE